MNPFRPVNPLLEQIGPMSTGQATTELGTPPIAPGAGLSVLATSLLAGALLLRRRDA